MSAETPVFSGWGAFGKDSIEGKLKHFTYEPKKWDEEDVDSEQLLLHEFAEREGGSARRALALTSSPLSHPTPPCPVPPLSVPPRPTAHSQDPVLGRVRVRSPHNEWRLG